MNIEIKIQQVKSEKANERLATNREDSTDVFRS